MYKPFLDPHGLTYTQYIVLLVLWEEDHITVSDLGKKLFLDSGTLTPLLKKLETANLVNRKRSSDDERTVIVSLTRNGTSLQKVLIDLPRKLLDKLGLGQEDSVTLKGLLDKMLSSHKDYKKQC